MSDTNDLTAAKDLLPRIQVTGDNLGYEVCRYCGKHLPYRRITMFGQTRALADLCDCKESQIARDKELLDEIRAKNMAETVARLYESSGIKRKYMGCTLDNYDTEGDPRKVKALLTAQRYVETFGDRESKGEGLYIHGGNGTGKTHLVSGIAHALIQRGVSVTCSTYSVMLLNIRDRVANGYSEMDAISRYIRSRLLVIDDLGKEKPTEWSLAALYNIINMRYEDAKPTIITANYGYNGLTRALTPGDSDDDRIRAIVSRLMESTYLLYFDWDDNRRRCDE